MTARDRVFAKVDAVRRVPSIAEIGGFRPEPGMKSWFGGNFHLPKDEPWPKLSEKDAIPLIQIVISELPACPEIIRTFAVIQVYLDQDELPIDLPARNGDRFLVRHFGTTEELVPCRVEPTFPCPKKFPIRWKEGKLEGPVWTDAYGSIGGELVQEFVKEDDCFSVYTNRYFGHVFTKVGGWPTFIQDATAQPGEYVFQIGSEEKPKWMIGDNGKLYFFLDENQVWWMLWDCY